VLIQKRKNGWAIRGGGGGAPKFCGWGISSPVLGAGEVGGGCPGDFGIFFFFSSGAGYVPGVRGSFGIA